MIGYYERKLIDWFNDHEQAAQDAIKYCGIDSIDWLFDQRSDDRKKFDEDFEHSLSATAEEINSIDDYEAMSEYLEDALDISVTRSLSGGFENCKVWLTVGGPGVYIDTADKYLKGRWGSTSIDIPLSFSACDLIDDYVVELSNCF